MKNQLSLEGNGQPCSLLSIILPPSSPSHRALRHLRDTLLQAPWPFGSKIGIWVGEALVMLEASNPALPEGCTGGDGYKANK